MSAGEDYLRAFDAGLYGAAMQRHPSVQDAPPVSAVDMAWTVDDDLDAGALPYVELPPDWLAWRDQVPTAPEPVVLPGEDYDTVMAQQEAAYEPDLLPSYGHSPAGTFFVLAALAAVACLVVTAAGAAIWNLL